MISENKKFFAIVALAFGLRVVGAHFGLPQVYHQDEPILVNHAMSLGVGGWNPHFFVIPPFTIYSLFVSYGLYFFLGKMAGLFADKTDFALSFLKDPSVFYLWGRFWFGVVFGTATVALVVKMGKRFFSLKTGLLSGLFLAICPIHVQHSHYLYADIPVAFGALLLVYRAMIVSKKPSWKNFVKLGLVLGWAVSVKYTAAYFLPALLAAWVMVFGRRILSVESLGKMAVAGVVSLAVYALIAPYTFLDWPSFYAQLKHQAGAESATGFFHHLTYSIIGGTSLPFVLLAFFGIAELRKKDQALYFILGTAVLFYYLVNTQFSQHFARYMIPLVPLLALLAGEGWEWLSSKLGHPVFKAVIFSFFVLNLAIPSVYSTALFLKKDTRTQCLEWMSANIQQGAGVAVDNRFFGPRLWQSEEQIEEKYAWLDGGPKDAAKKKRLDLMKKAVEGEKTYRVYLLSTQQKTKPSFLFQGPFIEADLEKLRGAGIECLVVNYADFDAELHALVNSWQNHLTLAAVFSPYKTPEQKRSKDRYDLTAAPHLPSELFSRNRLGPYLEVYKITAEK
jgi:hypothetical protein